MKIEDRIDQLERIVQRMHAALKVFGGNLDGQHRVIMACTSRTQFCKVSQVSRDFACETGNQQEIRTAMAEPGMLFVKKDAVGYAYRSIGPVMDYEAIHKYDLDMERDA